MKGILIAFFLLVAVLLYGCVRAGAQEDRLMEELTKRGEQDADKEHH